MNRRKFLKLIIASGSTICIVNPIDFLNLKNSGELKLVLGYDSNCNQYMPPFGDIKSINEDVYSEVYHIKNTTEVTEESVKVHLRIIHENFLTNELILYLNDEYLIGKKFPILYKLEKNDLNFDFDFETEENKQKFRRLGVYNGRNMSV